MNTIQIAGRLGADPETRVTPKGVKVTTLRVATNTFQAGKEETIWWRVTIWDDAFKNIVDHLKKGSAVVVTGEMRSKPETYVDKAGVTQVQLNITALSVRFSPFSDRSGQEGQRGSSQQPYQGTQRSDTAEGAAASYGSAAQYAEAVTDDDEMPF